MRSSIPVLALTLLTTSAWAAGEEARFARRCASEFATSPTVCVGQLAGFQGDCSLYAGLTQEEADAAGYDSPGYGSSWNVFAVKQFDYTGGDVTLSFDYAVDLERGADFFQVLLDTTGVDVAPCDRNWLTLARTDRGQGTMSFDLRAGLELPVCSRPVRLGFRVISDGAWSDADGLYPTDCGAVAIDDVQFTGGIQEVDDFESDTGWEEYVCETASARYCYDFPRGALAWWPLDEGTGTVSQDIVGGLLADHTAGVTWRTGVYDVGQALEFSLGSRWETSHDPRLDLGTGDFSIFLLVRVNPATVLSKLDAQRGFEITIDASNDFQFTMGDGSNVVSWPFYSSLGFDRHFVVVSVDRDDPSGARFYVDGALVAELDPTSVVGSLDTTTSLVSEGGRHHLDEVMLFDRALDPAEVLGKNHQLDVCNRDLHVPWITSFCDGQTTAVMSVEMCNFLDPTALFDLEFTPHVMCDYGGEAGCEVEGSIAFVPLDPLPVLLGPGDCASVRIQVDRPGWLTDVGQTACYEAAIVNLDNAYRTPSVGSIMVTGDLCVRSDLPSPLDLQVLEIYPAQQHPLRFRVQNVGGAVRTLDYTLRTLPSDRDPRFIGSQLGGPEPTSGTLVLNPTNIGRPTTELEIVRIQPRRFTEVLLLGDIDADGRPEPLASMSAKGVLASPVSVATVPRSPGLGDLAVHPNPFAGITTIRFRTEAAGEIEAAVYDLAGRHVQTVHAGRLSAGPHELRWDGRDQDGQPVARGVYLVRVRGSSDVLSGKILHLR